MTEVQAAVEAANRAHERGLWLLGGGITLLGGLVGFGYGVWKHNHTKSMLKAAGVSDKTASTALGTELVSGAEGALIGLIIAVIVVVAFYAYYHSQAASHRYQTQALANMITQRQLSEMASMTPKGAKPAGAKA